jgi:glycerol-3-phosphate responsive antiterminator
MRDTDFEFNMDFALMDQQIEKFKEENSSLLREWYQDCELLNAQIADLHNINKELELRREETIMQCDLLKQDLAKTTEVLKYIEEQSRHSSVMIVGAQLREAVCDCLNGICGKIDK